MRWTMRLMIVAATLIVTVGAVFQSRPSFAVGKLDKKMAASVDKIADALAKGKPLVAARLVKKIADDEEEVYGVMLLLKLRGKKGVGVGAVKGKIAPDGIERLLESLGKKAPKKAFLKQHEKALIKMAYRTAAIAAVGDRVTKHMRFTKKRPKNVWTGSLGEMRGASLALAAAVKKNDPAAVTKIAKKIEAACTRCHMKFK